MRSKPFVAALLAGLAIHLAALPPHSPARPRAITGIDLSVLVAFANVGVLMWFARILWDQATAAAMPHSGTT